MPGRELTVRLFVVLDSTFDGNILFGRDSLYDNNLRLEWSLEETRLVDLSERSRETFEILNTVYVKDAYDIIAKNLDSDLEYSDKTELLNVIKEVNDTEVEKAKDEFLVKVHLKDDTIFSYGSRRFSYNERLELQNITDDLLRRKIIKPSISP